MAYNGPNSLSSFVLLQTKSAVGAPTSIVFTGLIMPQFKSYYFNIYGFIPETNARFPGIQFSYDNGATYQASSYLQGSLNQLATTGVATVNTASTTNPRLNSGNTSNTAASGFCAEVWLFNPLGYGSAISLGAGVSSVAGNPLRSARSVTTYLGAPGINAIKFYSADLGNITRATVSMYGIFG